MIVNDFHVRYYDLTIHGLDGRFVVAKLRRVSSPPIQFGSVAESMPSALGRLADIIRLGPESRNCADVEEMAESLGINVEEEWAAYCQVICRTLEVQRLEPFSLKQRPRRNQVRRRTLPVALHQAEMNGRPYVVARVGDIMGSPAPTLLTWPNERESALARLDDLFRIGVRGQTFRDFTESGRRTGMDEAELVREWQSHEQAVLWEMQEEHPSLLTIEELMTPYLSRH